MTQFENKVRQIINKLDFEHRAIVMESLRFSDCTPESFELELVAARWENPNLPLEYIMDQVTNT